MDSHTHGAFGRLEVIETGRRRRWSEDEKLKIVLESLAGPRRSPRPRGDTASPAPSFSLGVARCALSDPGGGAVPGFVPAVIVPEPPTAKPSDDRIEIALTRGRRIIVGAGFSAAALARVLDVLERR